MIDWKVQGEEIANCNCKFGCPCQFGVLPTDNVCEAAVAYRIDKGHYGKTSLDGVKCAAVYKWPGPIHEGNGEMQLIFDEATSPEQREALQAIMTGQDTQEMATMWFVYGAMSPTRHETLIAPIELEINAEDRIAMARVGDIFELDIRPIPHIVTGDPHRIGIALPNGFEFKFAEFASGDTRTIGGEIKLDRNTATHAALAALHMTGQGALPA